MQLPRLSIVIPTYNRAPYLERLLEALARQDTGPEAFEVVVADDGSTDGTADVLAFGRVFAVRSLRQENAGPGAARNAAIALSQADLILFLDDDIIPASDLVRRHLDAQRKSPGVVMGRMLHPAGVRLAAWAEWETRTLERQYEAMSAGRWSPTPRQFYTANASVPRQLLLDAGLFDERFRRAEDVELAYRLAARGASFRFVSDAVVEHDTPRTLSGWMTMAAQYGAYDVVMDRDKGHSDVLESMAIEFHTQRKSALRGAARLVVGRRVATTALRRSLPLVLWAADAVRQRRVALALCSVAFNLLYWDALARELGGRSAFWALIERWREYAAGEPEQAGAITATVAD
jgi:glycosyltransferase involved in cell wall biosynthesis